MKRSNRLHGARSRSVADACGVKRSQRYLNLVKRLACCSLFCAKCPSSRFGPAEGKDEREGERERESAQVDSDEVSEDEPTRKERNRKTREKGSWKRARFLGCCLGPSALYEFYTVIITWLLQKGLYRREQLNRPVPHVRAHSSRLPFADRH